jgi:regulator of protease activity HflC (stomatin/prohibitin superfamily)
VVFIIIVVIVLLSGFRILKEYERAVVFRLGRCIGYKGPGLIYVIPFIDIVDNFLDYIVFLAVMGA